jgi:hypothetical protein
VFTNVSLRGDRCRDANPLETPNKKRIKKGDTGQRRGQRYLLNVITFKRLEKVSQANALKVTTIQL